MAGRGRVSWADMPDITDMPDKLDDFDEARRLQDYDEASGLLAASQRRYDGRRGELIPAGQSSDNGGGGMGEWVVPEGGAAPE